MSGWLSFLGRTVSEQFLVGPARVFSASQPCQQRSSLTSPWPWLLGTRNKKTSANGEDIGVTLKAFTKHWTERFHYHHVPEPELSVKYILEHIQKQLTTCGSASGILTSSTLELANHMMGRRLKREPVQYIIGEWDFRNVTLQMKPPVLIPRPETEQLVGLALENLEVGTVPLRFLDLGCGSGAIAVSLLQENNQLEGFAVDCSEDAVHLTEENAQRNSVADRLKVIHASIQRCQAIFADHLLDLIVSNPPYVTSAEMKTLEPEILWYEDRRALCGGEDGMSGIRSVVRTAGTVLKSGGQLWLEVGSGQNIRALVTHHSEWEMEHISAFSDFTQNGMQLLSIADDLLSAMNFKISKTISARYISSVDRDFTF